MEERRFPFHDFLTRNRNGKSSKLARKSKKLAAENSYNLKWAWERNDRRHLTFLDFFFWSFFFIISSHLLHFCVIVRKMLLLDTLFQREILLWLIFVWKSLYINESLININVLFNFIGLLNNISKRINCKFNLRVANTLDDCWTRDDTFDSGNCMWFNRFILNIFIFVHLHEITVKPT